MKRFWQKYNSKIAGVLSVVLVAMAGFFWLGVPKVKAAPAYNADATNLCNIGTGSSSCNGTFTVPSTNPLVVIYTDEVDTTSLVNVSTVTCGAASGALIARVPRASSANRQAEMWYCKAPPTGSQ